MEEIFLNLKQKGKERVKITDFYGRTGRPNVYNESSERKKKEQIEERQF